MSCRAAPRDSGPQDNVRQDRANLHTAVCDNAAARPQRTIITKLSGKPEPPIHNSPVSPNTGSRFVSGSPENCRLTVKAPNARQCADAPTRFSPTAPRPRG